MAISIDWGTKVINIPKADLTVVQLVPTEIYSLDLNAFHLELKDLEDSLDGMAFERTHKHNTEVTLSGITLARVIEIINGYTITFENGAYAVNLQGANSNVGDKTNVNNVSIRSANSAGLISVSGGGADAASVWNYLKSNPTVAGSMKESVEKTEKKANIIPALL